MLAAERHERITVALRSDGAIRVVELAEQLGVSEMTIRRDLEVLDEREVLRKVHGGAIARGNRGVEPPSTDKAARQHAEKVAIARAAVGVVEDGMTIAISAGTTTLEFARLLRGRANITVVTNSISIFQELTAHTDGSGPTVYLTGGSRTPSDALVGPIANATLDTFRVDSVFMGVHGFDVDSGLTSPNISEAETNRRLIATGRRLFVLADNTKHGEVGTAMFARIAAVDTLVVDDGLDEAVRAEFAQCGTKIVVADTEAI